jgi:hypothetical protein
MDGKMSLRWTTTGQPADEIRSPPTQKRRVLDYQVVLSRGKGGVFYAHQSWATPWSLHLLCEQKPPLTKPVTVLSYDLEGKRVDITPALNKMVKMDVVKCLPTVLRERKKRGGT